MSGSSGWKAGKGQFFCNLIMPSASLSFARRQTKDNIPILIYSQPKCRTHKSKKQQRYPQFADSLACLAALDDLAFLADAVDELEAAADAADEVAATAEAADESAAADELAAEDAEDEDEPPVTPCDV